MSCSSNKMKIIPKGIILSCISTCLNRDEISFFSKINPFGFILFSRNFESKKQLKKLVKSLKEVSENKNPLIFVDHEGGRVQRFSNSEFTKIPSQKFFGDLYKKNKNLSEELAYLYSKLMAIELRDAGVDVNCSPVLDIYFGKADKIIGDRSFSDEPISVSKLGNCFCKGMKKIGILPVIKHFPGHGRSNQDSHKTLPLIDASFEKLDEIDLVPFRFLKNEVFIMVAHILYIKLDKMVATYSEKIIKNILRKKLSFKGLVLSDDIDMKALKGKLTTRVINSYNGGCDIVLYCSGILDDMKKIYEVSKNIEKKKYFYFENYIKKLKLKKEKKVDIIKKIKELKIIG